MLFLINIENNTIYFIYIHMCYLSIRAIKILHYTQKQQKINEIIDISKIFIDSVNDKKSYQQINNNYIKLISLINIYKKYNK